MQLRNKKTYKSAPHRRIISGEKPPTLTQKPFADCRVNLLPWINHRLLNALNLANNPHPAALKLMKTRRDYQPSSEHTDFELYRRLARNSSCDAVVLLLQGDINAFIESCVMANFQRINEHPMAIQWLSDNPQHLLWNWFSHNPSPLKFAVYLRHYDAAAEYWDDEHWNMIAASPHPDAIELLQKYEAQTGKLSQHRWALATNPHPWVVNWLRETHTLIDADVVCANPHPFAIKLMQLTGHHDIKYLARNPHPYAIETLRLLIPMCGPHHCVWRELCNNPNPDVIDLFASTLHDQVYRTNCWSSPMVAALIARHNTAASHERIFRMLLVGVATQSMDIYTGRFQRLICLIPHASAMEYLRLPENRKYIDWELLARNPAIFAADEYEAVCREHVRGPLSAELMARMWNPRNMARFADWGVDAECEM